MTDPLPAMPALQISGISKSFPGVLALDNVDLDLFSGQVHALAGENGAGKSSLIKVLCGAYPPDGGTMLLGGENYSPHSPFDAIGRGIRVVHQELLMLEQLTVAENLLFESLPRTRWGLIDRTELNRRASELLNRVGLDDVSPNQIVHGLGMAQRQLIEIAKALSGSSQIVIMDEPTATLTSRETQRLFDIIAQLRDSGVALLFVSHHLQELFEICDSVTVLRNGRKVSTQPIGDTTPRDLVRMMVGREVVDATPRASLSTQREEALRVEGLRFNGQPPGMSIDFAVGKGEILGVAGLVGSGRTETMRALFGADPLQAGRIFREGRPIKVNGPADALAEGICLVTEDRKDEGLLLDMSIRENLSLARLGACSSAGWLLHSAEVAAANEMAKTLQIRLTSIEQPPRTLSGGNQQKVVLGKWLLCEPSVLILDEPTRGVDVGAKAEIHRLLQKIGDAGKALIVVSSDLPELMQIADRIIVLSRGKIAGEVAREEFDESRILELAYSEYMKTGETDARAA